MVVPSRPVPPATRAMRFVRSMAPEGITERGRALTRRGPRRSIRASFPTRSDDRTPPRPTPAPRRELALVRLRRAGLAAQRLGAVPLRVHRVRRLSVLLAVPADLRPRARRDRPLRA